MVRERRGQRGVGLRAAAAAACGAARALRGPRARRLRRRCSRPPPLLAKGRLHPIDFDCLQAARPHRSPACCCCMLCVLHACCVLLLQHSSR